MRAASLLDTMPRCRQTEEAFCLCIEQVFEDGGFVLRRDLPRNQSYLSGSLTRVQK